MLEPVARWLCQRSCRNTHGGHWAWEQRAGNGEWGDGGWQRQRRRPYQRLRLVTSVCVSGPVATVQNADTRTDRVGQAFRRFCKNALQQMRQLPVARPCACKSGLGMHMMAEGHFQGKTRVFVTV